MSDFEDRVENSLDKLHAKVDVIQEKVNVQAIETAKNTMVLEEHQRRSIANEEQVNLLREYVQPTITLVEKVKSGAWVAFVTAGLTYGGHKVGIIEMILKMFS